MFLSSLWSESESESVLSKVRNFGSFELPNSRLYPYRYNTPKGMRRKDFSRIFLTWSLDKEANDLHFLIWSLGREPNDLNFLIWTLAKPANDLHFLCGHLPENRMTSTSLYGHWPKKRMTSTFYVVIGQRSN